MTDDSTQAASQHPRPSAGTALLMTLGVIPLIGGYVVLCGLLGITEFSVGFLFLLCWTGFEGGTLAKLPNAALGGALGLALCYVLKMMMASSLGTSGGYVFGALALSVVFLHIKGWLSLLVNFSCMTFLATLTIPHVQLHGDFRNMLFALLFGVVYFGVILGTIERLRARRQSVAT